MSNITPVILCTVLHKIAPTQPPFRRVLMHDPATSTHQPKVLTPQLHANHSLLRMECSKAARKSAPSRTHLPPSRHEARKRTYSELDGSVDGSRKVTKLSGEERIKELEAQVRELQEFIVEKGFAYGLCHCL
jgi:hypothetical protein